MLKQFSPSLKASKLDRGRFGISRNRDKMLVTTIINTPDIISSSLDKVKCFVLIFASNTMLDHKLHFFPNLHSRTEHNLSDIFITAREDWSIIKILDPHATDPYKIPLIDIKNINPALSRILVKLFNHCFKEKRFLSL